MSNLPLEANSRRITEACASEIDYWAGKAVEHWAQYCESPIEVMFLAACQFTSAMRVWMGKGIVCEIRKDLEGDRPPRILIVPQYEWGEYRIDFAFFLPGNQTPVLFVECDGHDFHERTKEQAEYDRSRDRAIQQAGIGIFRFTGREIYRDPFKCVYDMGAFLEQCTRKVRP